jgi:hypothetical protein
MNPIVDLSQVISATTYNAFKNDGFLYTGSLNFPTSITAGATSTVTSVITLGEAPQFSKFYAYFQEYLDATVGGSAEWYPASVGSQWNVGIHVSAPGGDVGWLNCAIYPVINGQKVTVTGIVFNPYSGTITLTALNVPFAFVEYTLAN